MEVFWICVVIAVAVAGYLFWPAIIGFPAIFLGWLSGVFMIFAFGTGMFWLLMFVSCGILFWAVEMASWADNYYNYDKRASWLTLVTIVVTFLLLQFFGDIKIFSLLFSSDQWWKFWLYFGGYFVAGGLWSIPKFSLYAKRKLKPEYAKMRAEFLSNNKIEDGVIPDALKERWFQSLPRHLRNLDPNNHKKRILCWMMAWPFSIAWSLVGDLLKEIWDSIYDMLSKVYKTILERHFKEFERDFTKSKPQ